VLNEVLDDKLIEKMKTIRLLVLDVDGVMTDGKIIMNDMGREIKNFDVKDGHGIKILMRCGIDVILLTGRRSAVVEHRAKDIGIEEVYQGIFNKLEKFEEILQNKAFNYENIAFMGDDIVDIPLLKRVGFSVAVADATEEVKMCVDYITKKAGGDGAVREVCELILQAQGKWIDVAKRYEFP
jgi:3-deoxy-D-manno-octulosonate 8-phosphate phosphatase (KDO 8-P phosphatase)